GITDFLHRLLVNVRTHDLLDHAVVVRRPGDHAPAPELAEPPLAVFGLRIVAVALAENHVAIVLLLSLVAVIVVAQQSAEDDLLVTIDVGWPADDFTLFRTVVQIIEPHAR